MERRARAPATALPRGAADPNYLTKSRGVTRSQSRRSASRPLRFNSSVIARLPHSGGLGRNELSGVGHARSDASRARRTSRVRFSTAAFCRGGVRRQWQVREFLARESPDAVVARRVPTALRQRHPARPLISRVVGPARPQFVQGSAASAMPLRSSARRTSTRSALVRIQPLSGPSVPVCEGAPAVLFLRCAFLSPTTMATSRPALPR